MKSRRHFWNDPVLTGALAFAYALFAFTFRGPRPRFWTRMTRTGLLLGSVALVAEPRLRREMVTRAVGEADSDTDIRLVDLGEAEGMDVAALAGRECVLRLAGRSSGEQQYRERSCPGRHTSSGRYL